MRYTNTIEDPDRSRSFGILARMEEEYRGKNAGFFNQVLEDESSLVIRVHAITVLSEIGNEDSVRILGDALRNDPSSLIRHECAFSMGQIGKKVALPFLIEAVLKDVSEIVRHESAAALGSLGVERARATLIEASKDPSEEVRGSALASLFNLDYLRTRPQNGEEGFDAVPIQNTEAKDAKRMPHP